MNDAPPPDRSPENKPGGPANQPDDRAPDPHGGGPHADSIPEAHLRARRPFQLIWLIPLVAAIIAGYLGWQAIYERGPTISITFNSGDGLQSGQTKVRHKAVDLGTVQSVSLTQDLKHVVVRVQMQREATPSLTANARFWVVRPRLAAGNISGLDTLLSGSYIEMDPGVTGGGAQTQFTGLEEPPAVRSDEPGTTFTLKATRVPSLSSGSPVFYRDIPVGEVLGYDMDQTGEDFTVHAFVRAPYDTLVRAGSHFWNASGIAVDLGSQGVQVRLESLQAILSGGVAFDTSADERQTPPGNSDTIYKLYGDERTARAAGYTQRIPFLAYFEGSVRGLAVGASVELYGIQIGNVTDVNLEFNPTGNTSRVAVRFEVQPERFLPPAITNARKQEKPIDVARTLVGRGLRAQLRTANFLTGQMVLAMDFFPGMPPAPVSQEGDAVVLPALPGGLDNLTSSLGEVARKLAALPLDQTIASLNETLASVRDLAGGPEMKRTLASLSETMANTNDLIRKADAGLGPAMTRLPEIAQSLQAAVERANRLIGSADTGYGANSQFNRDLGRLLAQVSDTARSVRLLADYLDAHPESLIRGRAGTAAN